MSAGVRVGRHAADAFAVLLLVVGTRPGVAGADPPVCVVDPSGTVSCVVSQPGSGGGGGGSDGSGGGVSCVWSQVRAVPGVDTVRVTPAGTVELLMLEVCGDRSSTVWVPVRVGSPAAGVVLPPAVLVPALRDEVVARLPLPVPHVAPSDIRSDGLAFTQVPTFFWVAPGAGQWAPVAATAAVPAVSVTVTASPVRLRVDPGDGSPVVGCDGAPRVYRVGDDPATFDGCRVVFHHSSTVAPNGQSWPVTVTIDWHIAWTATDGESGDLGVVGTSTVKALAVGEDEALVTGVGP